MKRMISVLFSLLLMLAVLSGCGEEKVKNPPLDAGSSQPSEPSGPVTEEEAGELAFDRAGTESQYVSGYRLETETDDGRSTYDIEFYSDGHHYEVEIDPATGQIISYDKD